MPSRQDVANAKELSRAICSVVEDEVGQGLMAVLRSANVTLYDWARYKRGTAFMDLAEVMALGRVAGIPGVNLLAKAAAMYSP